MIIVGGIQKKARKFLAGKLLRKFMKDIDQVGLRCFVRCPW